MTTAQKKRRNEIRAKKQEDERNRERIVTPCFGMVPVEGYITLGNGKRQRAMGRAGMSD